MLDTADVELIGLSKLSRISVIQLASLQKINQQYIQNIYVYQKMRITIIYSSFQRVDFRTFGFQPFEDSYI